MRRQKNDGQCTVIFQNTVVNDPIREKYGRLRPYTESVTIDLGKYNCIPVEHLNINARFSHRLLNNIFYCFPKLHRLSIDYLVHSCSEDSESCPIRLLKDLKYVSLKLYLIKLNKFRKTVQNFFPHLEVL
jgi:hypothetical protein